GPARRSPGGPGPTGRSPPGEAASERRAARGFGRGVWAAALARARRPPPPAGAGHAQALAPEAGHPDPASAAVRDVPDRGRAAVPAGRLGSGRARSGGLAVGARSGRGSRGARGARRSARGAGRRDVVAALAGEALERSAGRGRDPEPGLSAEPAG